MNVLRMLALAMMTSGCVAMLGLDEDKRSVVEDYCRCDPVSKIYGSKAACLIELDRALKNATEPTRAHWLETYAASCTECTKWDTCFKLAPTCTGPGVCKNPDCLDCCAPGTQLGTCGEEGT